MQITEHNFFKTACWFQGSLVLIAMLIGSLTDINPFATIVFSEADLFLGVLATLPLFVMFLVLYWSPVESLQQIRATLLETLAPMLRRYRWYDLLVLAAIAGITEEILFRGTLLPWFEQLWGATGGLIVSSILFGLVHAVTPMYAFLAASVGIYLGLVLDYGEQRNLLIPIVVHGFYDFLAFIAIMYSYHAEQAKRA